MNDRAAAASTGEPPGVPPGEPRAARAPHSRMADWALWLGVAGIGLGFLLLFAVLTPAAIVCGTRGLAEIRARPGLTGRVRAWSGIGLAIVAPALWVGLFVALLADGVIS